MRKLTTSFLLACLLAGGPAAVPGQSGAAQDAREGREEQAEEQGEEQWEEPASRDLWDSMWGRKNSRQRQKRRKYERVGVASSSAAPLRRRPPAAAAQRRPPARPARPSLAWQPLVLDASEKVGVTIWRLRRCGDGGNGRRCFLPLSDGRGRTYMYEALRVSPDADFRVGDGIQLAVESPVKAFVYVVHQEVYTTRQTGAPKLLYPLREGGNVVGPGRPLLIPAQPAGKEVKVLRMGNELGRSLSAERLKIIVSRKPLEGMFRPDGPRDLAADLRLWESRWSGRLELFDLDGGGDENMSLQEWRAMRGGSGGRDLTTGDLAPQKLYVVERKQNDGVLITLDLPYAY